jgi:hypothetical protein
MGGIVSHRSCKDMAAAVRVVAFAQWFAIPRGQAAVLNLLWEARGSGSPPAALAGDFGTTPGHVHVLVSRLRKKLAPAICGLRGVMEAESIDYLPGAGYCLTEVGERECREAMTAMAATLTASLAEAA